MNDWHDWANIVFGFLLTILGINYRMEKKRNEDIAREYSIKLAILSERVVKVESELMTEREVRQILNDYFGPFMSNMTEMQKDVQAIKVSLARLKQ